MGTVFQAAWEGLSLTISWPNILYPIAGTLLAMIVATIPGLSGVTLMALALPFTLGWEPLPTMLLFGALVGGATFMGSATAILVNIPGESANAVTTLDGYPLSQQGQAQTALGCSAAASALGSTFGILVLLALIPFVREIVLLFGPLEMMMLALWGLTTAAVIARGSMIKGLALAGLGFAIGFVGMDPRTAEPRYTFGTSYLQDGIALVPMFLGLFAVTEMLDLVVSGRRTISGVSYVRELSGSISAGVLTVFKHFGLFIRSSFIGTVIGIIPGVGGTVAGFVAYGHAVQTAGEDKHRFGKGDIRGVLAPEAAIDAKDGGALVPTLAFGVPGSAGTAMLLTVMTLHGVAPGLDLISNQLTLVFVLVWSLFLSNWLTSILGIAAVRPLTRLTVFPAQVLVPVILSVVAMAAYVYRGVIGDVILAFGVGAVGYYLKKHGWSRMPFVIALVLGPLFERHLMIYLQLAEVGRVSLWSRPIALVILALILSSLAVPLLRLRRSKEIEQRAS